MLFTQATLLTALAVTASAAKSGRTFAVNHFYGNGPLTVGRMDPIISPGGPSGHHHTIQGGSNFALTMSDTTLLQSQCTSSLVKNDKSNYWTPSLFFQDPKTGKFTPVPMFYMNVYYFFEATDDDIKEFQPGHRMVIGSPKLRSPPATGGESILDLAQGTPQPVQWTCPRSNTNTPLYPPNSDGLHGVGIGDPNNAGAGVGFPDQNCDGYASPLRADIHFPSCYNPAAGIDDYENNMQFPSSKGASAGGRTNCPAGWVHTPHIFYEVYWNTPLFADRWTPGQGTQPFVLSNGDPTGYSLHADFIAGWVPGTLQQIIDNCDAGDSGMDKCPGLIGGLNDPSTSCNIPSAIPDGFTISDTTVLSALPGNNPVTGYGSTPASGTSASAGTGTGSGTGSGSGSSSGTGASSVVAPPAGHTSPSSTIPSSGHGSGPASVAPPKNTPPTTIVNHVATSVVGYTTVTISSTTTLMFGNSEPTPTGKGTSSESSTVEGWTEYGCYSDKISGSRALSGITFANIGNHQVTTSKCITYCNSKGFSLAGTEYGGQCFCGNTLVGSSELSGDHCNMPCEGDDTQICGGSLALTVYKKSSSARRRRHLSSHKGKHLAQPLKV